MRSPGASPETAPVPTVAERLQRLIEVARRRWLILVSVTVVAALAAGIVASRSAEQYDATAKVLLSNSPIVGSTEPGGGSDPADPERDINTKIGLIRLEAIARQVRERLDIRIPEDALARKVTAEPEGTTDIVNVTATDESPARAAAIANGFAGEYVAFRERVVRSTLQEALAGLRRLQASLGEAELDSARGRAVLARIHELELASAVQTGGAQVVAAAAVPKSPSGPLPLRSAILGAVIGLMLALIIVALLELTGGRIRQPEHMERFDEAELELLLRSDR